MLDELPGREHETLKTYYDEVFATRLGHGPDTDLRAFMPASASGLALQTMYIAENPEPVGHKGRLDRAAAPCDYNRLHVVYHPRVREFKKRFGYYDVFLFDLHGNLVYSVSKETDFGTNFITGPYKDTNLAEVYRRARALELPGEVTVVDYSAYLPSYGAPASFIAAPVYHDGAKVGVLAFQMPIDEIDGIVCDGAGLGATGRVYLVGQDLLMRSDTRFESGIIFKQAVRTTAAQRAIAGESGSIQQTSFDGRQVVASFAPVGIEGLLWGITAEVDLDEIAAAGRSLRDTLIGVALIIGGLSLTGMWFLVRRVVVKPIRRLAAGARRVQDGDYSVNIEAHTSDEIGDLARAFSHMTGAVREDIEARLKSAAALAEAEQRSRMLLEATPDAMVIIDATGTIESVNAQTERLLGYRRGDLIGQPIELLVPEQHREGHIEKRDAVINDPSHPGLGAGRELSARRIDGTNIPVEISLSRLKTDDGLLVLAAVRDVTERKKAEEKLQMLSRAVEQSPVTVVVTDLMGNIEYVNPKFTDITGYSVEEAVGQNPRVLKSDKHPPEFYKDLWDTITAGRDWFGELCNRRKDGTLYWESASISPVRNTSGQVTHFVAVKEDVTEKRRIAEELREAKEAAEAATRAKSDFLANMSHEIRTPMNGIIGMTDLTLDTELTPEQRDYLNTVKTSADALLTLINDILDFSKIEAGKLELEPIDFALRDALADMLNTLANRAHAKGLELIYEVPSDVHDALIGDVYRVRQIVVNLVGNAIKFTESGEIVVSVAQVARSAERVTLQFSIHDTGIGIPANKLDAIFKPFEQADASTTRRFGGTGLGLTISVQLVELMGGRIWAESEIGQGSTFHFTAVFGLGQATTAAAPRRRELLEDLAVLVVDDNATNRRILEEMLKNWNMKPHCAANGPRALAALDRAGNAGQPFRLVLSDVNMPDMDGFQLFEQARANPLHHNIPFILLTSAARPGDLARCREIGVAAHLIKPVKQSLLMNAIACAVAGKEVMSAVPDNPQDSLSDSKPQRVLQILLAEDNAVNQKFAVRTIEKAGHAVFVANNGREAIEAWQREPYDVVLMDMQMPVMDGLEATAHIRTLERQRAAARRIPIIAMTANAMKGDKERCLEAGMDGYVAKPVKRQTLFAEIERVLAEQ